MGESGGGAFERGALGGGGGALGGEDFGVAGLEEDEFGDDFAERIFRGGDGGEVARELGVEGFGGGDDVLLERGFLPVNFSEAFPGVHAEGLGFGLREPPPVGVELREVVARGHDAGPGSGAGCGEGEVGFGGLATGMEGAEHLGPRLAEDVQVGDDFVNARLGFDLVALLQSPV